MLEQYRFHLQTQGPLIRLCLRFLLLFSFALLFLASLQSTTDHTKIFWNPFKGKKSQKTDYSEKDFLKNLLPTEDDDVILNEDPRFPRTRDWIYDHIYFAYYDGQRIYTNQEYPGGTVSRGTHHAEKLMLSEVQSRALRFFESKYPGKYAKDNCNSIRFRTIPTIGIEADVTCNDTSTGSVDRLNLLLPLRPPRITYHHSIHPTTAINIIMPLKGRMNILKLFMQNLIEIMRGNSINIGLTVVYFRDENVDTIEGILKKSERQDVRLKTHFILLNDGEFSRGRGLQIGVEQTNLLGEVLFFCDVDVLFTKDFLTRCLSTPVRGHQVFIPMVFSQYNPEFVYPLKKHFIPMPLEQLNIKDDYGYWRVWGHGMVCAYKSDFHRIGGFNTEAKGWGGEDLNFVRKIIKASDYKIIRSLEPGLFHLYHKKECDDTSKHYSCTKMKAANEASKMSLALWYFKQTEGISVYGALVEGNQPHYHDEIEADARGSQDSAKGSDTGQNMVTHNLWLWEKLSLLVLFSVIALDMFLMIQNMRMARNSTSSSRKL